MVKMEEVIKEVWKFHKRGIIISLIMIFSVTSLIFISSLQGKFVWIDYKLSIKEYKEFYTLFNLIILFLFIIIVFLYILFGQEKVRK